MNRMLWWSWKSVCSFCDASSSLWPQSTAPGSNKRDLLEWSSQNLYKGRRTSLERGQEPDWACSYWKKEYPPFRSGPGRAPPSMGVKAPQPFVSALMLLTQQSEISRHRGDSAWSYVLRTGLGRLRGIWPRGPQCCLLLRVPWMALMATTVQQPPQIDGLRPPGAVLSHTTLNTPNLSWSWKLSRVRPG